jgi:predicted enzyme related to lactoylglutathione lyase
LPSRDGEPEVRLSYRVDDITAAADRVRAAGGHADEPRHRGYGLLAECADDQGTTFHLWQPTD